MFKSRGLLLIVLSLIMGAGAAYTANEWVASQIVGETDLDGTQVVAAAMEIPYGTKVGPRHVKMVEIPEAAALWPK